MRTKTVSRVFVLEMPFFSLTGNEGGNAYFVQQANLVSIYDREMKDAWGETSLGFDSLRLHHF
jgi:hypothetical protein